MVDVVDFIDVAERFAFILVGIIVVAFIPHWFAWVIGPAMIVFGVVRLWTLLPPERRAEILER